MPVSKAAVDLRSRTPRRTKTPRPERRTGGDRARDAGIYGSPVRGRRSRRSPSRSVSSKDKRGRSPRDRERAPHARPKAQAKENVDRDGDDALASPEDQATAAFDKLYAEVAELPGKIVIPDEELTTVVFRLIAIGFSDIQAFAGLPPEDIIALFQNADYVAEADAPIINTPGAQVLIRRLCAEAQRRSYDAYASAASTEPSSDGLLRRTEATEKLLLKLSRRLRRKKKNVDRDSSVESDDDLNPFELGAFLGDYRSSKGQARFIEAGWFTDCSRLARLHRDYGARSDDRVPFVYPSTIDEWVPTWVGEARSKKDRKSLRAKMQSDPQGSLSNLLCLALGYWLSHWAAGAVSLPAVFAHILGLIRMAQERSVLFAYTYISKLQARIATDIKAGVRFDLDDRIANKDIAVHGQVELELLRDARGSRRQGSPPTRNNRADKDKSSAEKEKNLRKSEKGAGRGDKVGPPTKVKPVCFQSDPANNRQCTVKNCRFDHVDTRTSEGAKAFAAGKAAARR